MPTVSTMPFIKPHFHNNAGSPANGYKLYTYDSTTNDAIPLYKDPAGTIEYTNPILLNSRGEPDGMGLYLDNTKVYKMILKTENDTPVWTTNGVVGVNGNGSGSVPVISLPCMTVYGNVTENNAPATAVPIATGDSIFPADTDIASVDYVASIASTKLNNSGTNTYNGNLTISGLVDVNSLTIQGDSINDIFVNEDGHVARSVVGNKDITAGAVEDIPLVDSLASGSPNEIPSVAAVKTYVDDEVNDLNDRIDSITDSYKVKVSATDPVASFMETKLVEGNRVEITKITNDGEEKLRIDLNIDDLKDISYVFQATSPTSTFQTITNDAIFAGYDADPINLHSSFDVLTGKFTAVDSGYYHFDASALIDQAGATNTSICNMYLKHYDSTGVELGSIMAYASTPASATDHAKFTTSCAANFHMSIDDYVGIVFNVTDNGTSYVNKVSFGGYSLDSANASVGTGTPLHMAYYDVDGKLNPAPNAFYDTLHNIKLGGNNTVASNIAEASILGTYNSVNAQDAVAIGTQNTIGGGSNSGIAYAIGRSNIVNAPESMAVGIRNNAGVTTAGETMAVGIENTVDGSEIVGIGQDLDIDGADSTVVGQDITGSNLMGMVAVGKTIAINNSSNADLIVGKNFDEALIPVGSPATSVFGTTNNEFISLFGKYVDQFGNIGLRGRFLGFDSDNKLKVTNEVSDIQFMTTAGVTPVEGQLAWNDLDKTLNVGLAGGSVLQVGEEELVYAVNRTGTTINNGEVVYVSGSQGNRVVVSRAQAVLIPTTQVFLAVATQNINNNHTGYFTRFGIVRDINTAAYLEGDILWLSTTAGQMTSVQPAKPYSQIAIAIVTRAHATNGTIMVSPYVVPRLGQLTDVNTTGATNGQVLVYNASTGIWSPGNALGADTYKVQIDAEDESGPGYLAEKITAGDNIILTRTTGEHGTRIEIKADVNNVNLISSSFDAYASYGSGESDVDFGTFSGEGWVKDGTKIVATTAGKMQVNIAADISHKNSDLVNKFHLYHYTEIETCYRTDITFNSGVGGPDIIEYTVNHSGTYQLDINYDFKANSSGELQLWVCNSNDIYYQHYTFGGGNKGEYQFDTQSGSVLHSFSAGDKIRINMTVFGDGVSSVDIYGAQVSNITADEHPSYGLRLYHYTNGGTESTIYNIYDMPQGYSGLRHIQFASILDVAVGDYFKVYAYNPTYGTSEQNIHFNASILQAVVNNVQGATTLDELTDVDVSGAADGQILSYDSSTYTWIPVTGGGTDPTLDGLMTYPLIISNGSIATGHTVDQGATYTSARVIPAAQVEANYISCFSTQIGTFYGIRMGIYTPGPADDTLIAQTANLTTTPSAGIITLPILYDATGAVLTTPLQLQPNTSYMLAAVIKANGCQFASYTGIATNPPNHFGRKDEWNAPAPTNLMQGTVGYTQSSQFIWMSVSK